VAHLDGAAAHRAAGPISHVEQRFQSVEAVEYLSRKAAGGEERHDFVVAISAELVAGVDHARGAGGGVQECFQACVLDLVGGSASQDCCVDVRQSAGVGTGASQTSEHRCGDERMDGSLMARKRDDGVNLQADRTAVRHADGMELHGARTLVTGGTTGVGASLVRLLVELGAQVVTCGSDAGRCDALRAQYPGITVVVTDLATPGSGRRLVDEAAASLGGLDIVINNAAVQIIEQFTPPQIDGIDQRIVDESAVNLRAPIEIIAASLPWLAESGLGSLVFVTSGLAVFPKKSAPVYCATKSALRTFATTIRYQTEEFAPNVQVIDVVLPLVDTPMTAGRGSDSSKMSSDAVAARIIDAIRGTRRTVHVGKARLLPWFQRPAPSIGRRILRGS